MKFLYIILILTFISCSPEKTNVKGIVTYFFNENYGQKPDLGAEIFFIKKDGLTQEAKDKLMDLWIKWSGGKSSYQHMSNSNIMLQAELDFKQRKITKKHYSEILTDITNLEYAQRDSLKNSLDSIGHMSKNIVTQCVADANGSFNVMLSPGKYFVYVIYANRDGIQLELNINVPSEKEIKFDFNKFDL